MELYIRVDEDGNPIEHPILKENLDLAPQWFKDQNTFVKFERREKPKEGVYEIAEVSYTKEVDGDGIEKFVDNWQVRPMSDEEVLHKQNNVRLAWLQDGGFNSWVFDPETCTHKPPKDYPTDGDDYLWAESTQSWEPHSKFITPVPTANDANSAPLPPELQDENGRRTLWNPATNSWDDLGDFQDDSPFIDE